MRWHHAFIYMVVVFLILPPVVTAHDPGIFIESINPEKIELFNKFDRLELLPPSFELDHMDEVVSRDDCFSLITSIADWGENLWISRTNSGFTRVFLKVRRFFGYVNPNFVFLEKVSDKKNATFLMMAKRWGLKINVDSLNTSLSGWEMLEMEYVSLSKMLSMAGIPRSLIDEVKDVLSELGVIQDELGQLQKTNMVSGLMAISSYRGDKYIWAYYLTAIQHGLLPETLVEAHFTERATPQRVLNLELTMYHTLLFASEMMDYLDSFSGQITGFVGRVEEMRNNVLEISEAISEIQP